jgi:asparagine synthase (glutamine-hydrolysing)
MLSGDGGDEVFGSYGKPNVYNKYSKYSSSIGSKFIARISRISNNNIDKYLSDKNRIRIGGWQGFYSKNNLNYCFSQVFS